MKAPIGFGFSFSPWQFWHRPSATRAKPYYFREAAPWVASAPNAVQHQVLQEYGRNARKYRADPIPLRF
jgi:hypothetical protein